MAEGEAQDELHARHALKQLVQACALPQLPGFVLPSLLRRGAASDSASNDHARSCFCCPRYDRLVFALERRVGDLENVEHAHGDMVLQVRQGGGHANEADLALPLEVEDGPNGVVFLKRLLGGAAMELQDIYIIRLHACQALMNTGQDVLARVDVSLGLTCGGCFADQTAALGRKGVVGAAVCDEPTDHLLALAVVYRRINVVDAGIENGAEHLVGQFGRDLAAPWCPTQLHGSVAQPCDLESGAAEFVLR